ncbi:putative YkwD family protein [Virgibacillus halotolerans]|uniref:CAP domain-containing protein n=1 Tax=Virgibacillus halotolerans TaxID=1071053 RepID=UPI00195F8E4F|nr:CAP domain-containing protein [Virgibacillus halotolerans]MBM7601977.1 putative YkwD family protein [Virgibacillus halotolerans]
MFNKIGIVTALSTALLVGGAFQSPVDASAKAEPSHVQSYKVFYSVGGQSGNISEDQINNLLNDCLGKFQIDWKKSSENNPQPEQKEQPNAETAEQPEQQAQPEPMKNEQPAKQEQTEQKEAPVQQPAQEQEQKEQKQTESQDISQFEQEVVDLTNQEREKQGLDPLEVDAELSKVAREKSKDMATNNYFDHNSPTYGSPFDMMKQYGISYSTAGENIAKGQRTPAEVVDGWMNSEGHRENILNGSFTHIGVGYVEQGNHWTQQFIGK